MAESFVLQALEWDITSDTSFFTVLEYLRHQGVLFENDLIQKQDGNTRATTQQTPRALDKCCDVMTLLLLQDLGDMLSINHYSLACAVVAASRRHVKLKTVWPQELE